MAPSPRGRGVSRRTNPGRGAWAPLSDPSPPIASLCVRAATRRAVLVYLIFFCGVFFLPPVVTVASTAATTATAITTTTTTTGEATATAADEDAENADSSATTPTTAATAATTTTITTPAITTTTTATAITTTDTDTDTTADKPEPHSQSAVEKDTSSVHPSSHPRPDSHPAPHLDPHLHPPRVLATPKHIFPPDKKIGDDGSKCWLFTHMPKSGGSTIRDLLRDKWGRDKCIKYGNPEWKYGKQKARNILAENYRIFAGSHAEALRRYGGERCQGFTMFRHPIPRVVSAYFYCKKAPIDPLCATSVMRAVNVDLLTFVQHWGNFGLRLFSLSMGDTDPNDVMDWANRAGQPVGASGWYLQRKYMEAHSERHDAPDAALYSFLAPAKEHLNTSFAAVGILENFEASLSLYDIALQMPGEGWHQWYAKIGPRNVDIEHKGEEEEALESAWTDPRFEYFLKLDLDLYDHAVKVHHEQLERYGLT